MSRVGKNPVNVPSGVEFNLTEALVSVKGKNGNLSMPLSKEVIVKAEGTQIFVQPRSNSKQSRMMWGTTKKLIENLVVGVHTG
ncbi:MAG: 50S ribosomal protein L6, partial [Candidatus Nucleicultricaceae bacterium]